jgi:propane monooxygenase coupling protein
MGIPGSPRASARFSVGISLMVSPETEATVEYVRAQMPNAIVDYRDIFYKIERDGYLQFEMSEISDYLGRAIDTNLFLVSMSSYYGRIVISDDKIEIFSEVVPDELQD